MNRFYANMKRALLVIISTLFISLGFSQTYTALNGPYGGSPRKIIDGGAGTLFSIVQSNGVLKSTNGGATWTASNTGLTNLFVNDLIRDSGTGKLYALTSSQVFTSTDNGANWVLAANTGFNSGQFIRKTSTFLFIVGWNSIVYRSSNDGVTWSQVNSFTGYPNDFEVNAAGNLFIVTEANGVQRSTNNGLNFDALGSSNGLTDAYHFSMTISGTTLYLLGTNTVNKSTNNGDTWTSAKGDITNCCFNWNAKIEKDPLGNILIFDSNGLFKTTNGGTNWTALTNPAVPNTYPTMVSPYFESATTFYIGLEGTALYKTTDGGSSWAPLFSPGLTANIPYDFIMTDNGRLLYAKGWPYGFYMSIDDGATWDFISSGVTARDIRGFTKVGSTIYAHGNGLIKTTNNAGTWTEVNTSYYFDNILSNDGTNLVSLSQNWNGTNWVWQLLKSNDGGVTWTTLEVTGAPSTDCSYISDGPEDIIMDASGNLYAMIFDYCSGTTKSVLYRISVSTGVATDITSQVPTVTGTISVQDIDFFSGNLYVFTSNSRIHVTPDGTNWTTKNTTTSFGNIRIIDANTYFILNSSVFLSTDAGVTWVNTGSPGSTNKTNRQALVSSINFSYIAQENGLVYKSNSAVIPPAAPSGLTSTGRDRNSIGLIFNDNSSNESYFIIEASIGDNLNYDSVGNTTRPGTWSRAQASFILSSIAGAALSSNTTYYLRVRAAGSGGKSAPSNEISVTTLVDCTATSAIPLNRSWTATTLNTSGVGVQTLLNQTVSGFGAGNYTIQNLPLGAGAGLVPTPQAIWSVGIEENCGSVFVASTSQYLSNGNGTWDPVAKTITMPWQTHPQYPLRTETTVYTLNANDPVPAAPTTLTATVFLPGTILLNWTNSNFTTVFEVERSTASGSGFVKIADVNFPTISYKDLDPALVIGTTYYYRVRAKNSTGASAYSPEANVIPRSNYLFLPMNNLPGKTFSRTGAGGTWGDIDGDGINDLILGLTSDSTGLNLAAPLVFKGAGNGQFSKLTIPEMDPIQTRNVSIVDINNDGRSDLFFSKAFSNDLLLIRNSDGSYQRVEFTEYTQGGLPAASWADYDSDGFIDLLVNTSLGNGSASDKILYKNNGGDGTFTRITEGELVTDFGATRHTQWADYDNDGDQDVLVLNQIASGTLQSQTRLYRNNGDGTFTRVLGSAFEAANVADRSCSWGDYDNDADLDVFISGNQNRLYRNNGDGTFTEMTSSVVAESTTTTNGSYGSAWADMDNDGDLDLFAMGFNTMFYYNNGDGTFTKYNSPELFNAPGLSKLYGPALEDVDNDGFLDFHNGGFSNPDVPNVIYRNTTPASASRRWLKINLSGTTSNRMGIGTRITVVAGGISRIREVQSNSGYATQSSPTQHIGLGAATTVTSITILWPSGITQTLQNVASNQTLNIIEDGAAPVVATLLPADAATNVAVNTPLEITFDEPPVVVAGKNLRIYQQGNATPIFTILATSGIVAGNKVTYTLSGNLVAAKTYTVDVEAGAFKDQYGNLTTAFDWSFETIDNVAPVITFTPPASLPKGFSSHKFSVTISDNSNTVSSAMLNHRKIGGSAFTVLPGVFNATDNKWEFTVAEALFDANGLEFFLLSEDPSGNEGRLPATSNFQTLLQYNTDNSQIPSNVLGVGGTINGWKIFTIPFDLGSGNSVNNILNELSSLEYKEDWRLLRYSKVNNEETWIEYPTVSQFIRGQGYFINIKSQTNIFIGDVTAPSNNRSNLFTLNLVQGWNQIGNPYLTPINWSDVVAYNTLTGLAAQIKTYAAGSYVNTTTLQPYEGGFVFADTPITISIPFAGQTSPGGRSSETTFEESDWILPLTLKQGIIENKFGGVGMHQQASLSADQFDDLNVPGFFEFIEMNFDHPEHIAKKFARDVIPVKEEHTWSFTINASASSRAELAWDLAITKNLSGEIVLFDEARQAVVDMKQMHTYSFNPGESATFKIYYGKNLRDSVLPTALYLAAPYPNPVQTNTAINFALPNSNGSYQVTLAVYNTTGQRVTTLAQGNFAPGFYQTQWLVEEETNGLYFIRLNVETGNKSIALTEKLIIHK